MSSRVRWLILVSLTVALLGGLLLLVAGPGTRWGWWSFRTGLALLKPAFFLGLAGAALALVGDVLAVRRHDRRLTVLATMALVIGLIAAAVPAGAYRTARTVPPIHDITTDTGNPPAFVAILPLRADAPNPAAYGGPEVARQQRDAYPDVVPLHMTVPPDVAFARAEAAARDMRWDIVAADPGEGRIEATAATRWFGFKDDVVVRIRPDGRGSRVDVRSVSRVGKSDVGTNARRIREFLRRLAISS